MNQSPPVSSRHYPGDPHSIDTCGGVHLTVRQVEIIVAIARGGTQHLISHTLGISSRTVEHHVRVLLIKCSVSNVAELVSVCHAGGILLPERPAKWSGRFCLGFRGS